MKTETTKSKSDMVVFRYNPFLYIPDIAIKLKTASRDSEEYGNLIEGLARSGIFIRLIRNAPSEVKDKKISKYGIDVIDYMKLSKLFIRTLIIAIILTVIFYSRLAGDTLVRFGKYSIAVGVLSLVFCIYAGIRSGNKLMAAIEYCIDKYSLPNPKFSTAQIKDMIVLECERLAFSDPEELNQGIPCGCYTCKKIFDSREIKNTSPTHLCPFCGATTVVTKRNDIEISEQVLADMHEYWLENE